LSVLSGCKDQWDKDQEAFKPFLARINPIVTKALQSLPDEKAVTSPQHRVGKLLDRFVSRENGKLSISNAFPSWPHSTDDPSVADSVVISDWITEQAGYYVDPKNPEGGPKVPAYLTHRRIVVIHLQTGTVTACRVFRSARLPETITYRYNAPPSGKYAHPEGSSAQNWVIDLDIRDTAERKRIGKDEGSVIDH
jgi:hypothetical protein